jgi:hypothetical protein
MIKFLPLILIMICTFSISEADGRQLRTHLTLGTSGGYTTNTYLSPILSEWDRSSESGFFMVSPAVSMQWNGTKQTAGVTGMGHFHQLTGERPGWAGGTAFVNASQRISPRASLVATAGVNRFESDYRRDLQWVQGGIDWLTGTFTSLKVRAGSNWRTYSGFADAGNSSSRYDSWGIEIEHLVDYRWQLTSRFYSSLGHLTEPGKGFSFAVSAGRQFRNGLQINLQTGLDRYSEEFQTETGGGGGLGQPSDVPGTATYSLEDHFVRSGLSARMPVHRNISLSARFANLLWMSNTDNAVLPDFELSAGVDVSLNVFRPAAGPAPDVTWTMGNERGAAIEVRYRGDGPIYLTGDFNDWDEPGIPLQRTGRNRFRAVVQASPGIYQYKILVRENGELTWLELAGTTATVDDGFGGRNGRIIIEDNK